VRSPDLGPHNQPLLDLFESRLGRLGHRLRLLQVRLGRAPLLGRRLQPLGRGGSLAGCAVDGGLGGGGLLRVGWSEGV
jgi:hypothetical protein